MKTLILVRHAKSDHPHALPDRDRPLAERGAHDAPMMGKRLHRRGVQPDLVISSPARRALETARLIADELHYPQQRILVDERLYPGDTAQVLEVIGELDERSRQVLLVAHNPGLSELAHRFAPHITHLPTCAAAEFDFSQPWTRIGTTPFVGVRLDSPRRR